MNEIAFFKYHKTPEIYEELFLEYVQSNDWGSGEDKIKITDEIFFEWLEDFIEKENNCEL